jgi:hypothetical protein
MQDAKIILADKQSILADKQSILADKFLGVFPL